MKGKRRVRECTKRVCEKEEKCIWCKIGVVGGKQAVCGSVNVSSHLEEGTAP